MQLAYLVENMKNKQLKLVRSVIPSADGNPIVTICPDWVQLLMSNACGICVKKIKTRTPSDMVSFVKNEICIHTLQFNCKVKIIANFYIFRSNI